MGADPLKNRVIVTLGLSAFAVTSAVIGTAVTQGSVAFASAPSKSKLAKMAAADALKASQALVANKLDLAVAFAESAVRSSPQDASYRALLGQAYLQVGRFASARDAFGDALSLSPNDARTALSLSLAQTASGDWSTARKTLDDHADLIPAADRGLAMALAGDPTGAVELLMSAARTPGADAKTRQNLALSLALAGRWSEAKSVVALDVAPDEVDARMVQWGIFANPKAASDQVASLLGVAAVNDPGLPVTLALNAAAQTQAVASVDSFMPGQLSTAAVEPLFIPEPDRPAARYGAPVATAALAAPRVNVTFAERLKVLQRPPATKPLIRNKSAVRPVMLAAKRPIKSADDATDLHVLPVPTKGNFFVQLGAFKNAAVARDGWLRATQRFAGFASHDPSGMNIKIAASRYYRLSLGGFTRSDATTMCIAYRASGGACFVRQDAGDRVASWIRAPRQLAMR